MNINMKYINMKAFLYNLNWNKFISKCIILVKNMHRSKMPLNMLRHLRVNFVIQALLGQFKMRNWTLITANMLSCHKTIGLHTNIIKNNDYKVAVQVLNSLQSNAAILEKIKKDREKCPQNNILQTEAFLKKTGIEVNDLNHLNVIHISGTKGKGSTAAFCESILRCHKFKTGFYSSPHLVAVRERIRINGQPLSQQAFSSYFWEVYDKLLEKKVSDDDMPAYFKFLTIMAYYVFLKEKVDVAIVEVGIGGEYDCTNVIRKPLVCGVTSLGLDHTAILGNSLENIAWHKAGIFKTGVTAFTVPQPPSALSVLISRATSNQSQLHVVPPLESYDWGNNNIELGLAGSFQKWNASLAIQLTNRWLQITNKNLSIPEIYDEEDSLKSIPISECVVQGLKNCCWSGRCQIIHRKPIVYFLDGAHTVESLDKCVEWYRKASKQTTQKESSVYRILVFNISGDRSPETLMRPLLTCNFDLIIFCPNFASVTTEASSDQAAMATSWKSQMERCKKNEKIWLKETLATEDKSTFGKIHKKQTKHNSFTKVFPCINDVINWVSRSELPSSDFLQPTFAKDYYSVPKAFSDVDQIQVLTTGSILLVGGFLGILDPDLQEGIKDLKIMEDVEKMLNVN